MRRFSQLVVALCAAFVAGPALAGPDVIEDVVLDSAGSLTATAQVVNDIPLQTINHIYGQLTGLSRGTGPIDDYEDMYQILITDPAAFSATSSPTCDGAVTPFETDFDTQLWLFSNGGHGMLGNNDEASFSMGTSLLPAGSLTGAGIGLYYLAISGAGNDPASDDGLIFDFASPTELSGPDGPGGASPITDWRGPGETGLYTICLTGARMVPEPTTAVMLVAAGLLGMARRRAGR